MATNTDLTKLVINRLTTAQYIGAESNNELSPNELYVITDAENDSEIDDKTISADSTYSSSKIDSTYAKKTDIENKQDKLTAGTGITITNNVISSTATGSSSSVTFRTWEA